MTKFMSLLGKCKEKAPLRFDAGKVAVNYETLIGVNSQAIPGVRFVIHRMSFGRRMELSRLVRDLSRRAEFLEAGTEINEKIEASILAQEIEAMYLRWGLVGIEGLSIDGDPAGAENLLQRGPEELTKEVVGAIKAQCGLSEAERKN